MTEKPRLRDIRRRPAAIGESASASVLRAWRRLRGFGTSLGIFLAMVALSTGCRPPDKSIEPPRTAMTSLEAPAGLEAFDTPNDRGQSITLAWPVSPTENTPDFMIRNEIRRRQLEPGLSDEEKQRIRDEVESLYRQEPRIEYRIYWPRPYEGLMSLVAGFHANDASKVEAGWGKFIEHWRQSGGRVRLDGIVGLVRLGYDIREAGAPRQLRDALESWEQSLAGKKTGLASRIELLSSLIRENLEPAEDLTGRLHACALALLTLARWGGDESGLRDFLAQLERPNLTFSQCEYSLEAAIACMGSSELAAEARKLMEALAAENRAALTEAEQNNIAARLEALEDRTANLWKDADVQIEKTGSAFSDLFVSGANSTRLFASIEKNISWDLLEKFPSSLNFEKKEADNTCDFRESGGERHFFKVRDLVDGLPYRFRVDLAMGDQVVPVGAADVGGGKDGRTVTAVSRPDWFDQTKLNLLVIVCGFTGLILLSIHRARKDPGMFIREIDGLNAIGEAISKAVELDRPVYYIMGLGAIMELPTIASLAILEKIAALTAGNDLKLLVPCYDPVVMAAAQDVVRDAYDREGKHDQFKSEDVFFVTSDRFSYAASVAGMLVRDRPGLTFLLGTFQAESLLIAEVGSSIGAVQISGTDQPAQIPFFITTSDYTLIGEELYAASAYLSRNALMLGSLRGQDVGKALLLLAIVSGVILNAFDIDIIWSFFS